MRGVSEGNGTVAPRALLSSRRGDVDPGVSGGSGDLEFWDGYCDRAGGLRCQGEWHSGYGRLRHATRPHLHADRGGSALLIAG